MNESRGEERVGFWDAAYREGEHLEHWEPEHPPAELAAAVAIGLVEPGMTALDVGCGAGCEAVYLASLGVHVVGVDSSVEALRIARRRSAEAGLEVDWRLGDVGALPVEDESIDLAIDRGCFHVISEERRAEYGSEILRVLRPGGALLLRGAARDDDEEGVVGIDDYELQRCFGELEMRCGPLVPLTLPARSGNLAGRLVIVRRRVS